MEIDRLSDILTWNPPPIKQIISGGILTPKSRLILFGMYDSFKTLTGMHMAFCLASGKPWFGYTTTATTVLLSQFEVPKAENRIRLDKYSKGNNLCPHDLWLCHGVGIKLDRDFNLRALEQHLDRIHPEVLILDPIYKILGGDIKNSVDVSRLLDNLDYILDKHNLALVLIGHTKKLNPDMVWDWGQELMGSSYFQDWADTAIYISRDKSSDTITLNPVRARRAEKKLSPTSCRISTVDFTFTSCQANQSVIDQVVEQMKKGVIDVK